jgi:hypothetical protein
VLAPVGSSVALVQKIEQLRVQGYVVIQMLAGDSSTAVQLGCKWHLVSHQSDWHLEALPS